MFVGTTAGPYALWLPKAVCRPSDTTFTKPSSFRLTTTSSTKHNAQSSATLFSLKMLVKAASRNCFYTSTSELTPPSMHLRFLDLNLHQVRSEVSVYVFTFQIALERSKFFRSKVKKLFFFFFLPSCQSDNPFDHRRCCLFFDTPF